MLLGWLATAKADESRPSRIVLVTNKADAAIMPLLRTELEALGPDVVLVDHGENEVIPDDLPTAARASDAVAAIRVVVAKGKVEVWIADRVTGKVTLREVVAQEGDGAVDVGTAVLRSVELLRVSLMELDAPHPPRGEVPPPDDLEQLVGFPESEGIVGVLGGAGVAWMSPDMPVVVQAHLRIRVQMVPQLHASAFAFVPFNEGEVSNSDGLASARPYIFGLSARYALFPSSSLIQPTFGLGGGLQWVRASGRADAPLVERSFDFLSPVVMAEAALALRVHDNVRLWVEADGGVSFRPAAVAVTEEPVITMSHGLVNGAVGVEIAIP